MLHDRYYDAARAAEERTLAMASTSLKVRGIHLELAARYDARVKANTARWPVTELVHENEVLPIHSKGGLADDVGSAPRDKSFTLFRSAAEEAATKRSEEESWENEGGHMSSTSGRVTHVPERFQSS